MKNLFNNKTTPTVTKSLRKCSFINSCSEQNKQH